MVRTAAVGAGALVLALGAGSAAGAPVHDSTAGHIRVKIRVPYFGDVTVARIVVRARPGIGVPVRLRLKVVNAAKLSPTIVAVGGVVSLHRRPFKYVSSIVVVNRRMPHKKPPTPYDHFLLVDLVDAKGSTPAETHNYFAAHVRVAWNVLAHFGKPRAQATLDLFQPVDADAETPMQQAIHERGLDAIPLVGLGARSPSSTRDTAPPATILADTTDMAQSACSNDAGHTEKTEKKVENDVQTRLNPISTTPASAKPCDLTRYAFKNLKLAFTAPGEAGPKSTFAFSAVAGSVCGDPAKTAWGVTYASTGQGTKTAKPTFSSANPFTIATRTFGTGNSITVKLQYATEDTPLMKISAVAKGKVTHVVASPAQAALTSNAVDSCS
jgi:hypothetical protein